MDIMIRSGAELSGCIKVPGDKSISHRSIMLGSLASGETHVTGLLEGEDVLATIAAFRAMGVSIQRFSAGEYRIQGVGLHGLKAASHALDMGNSGTAMRLMSGILVGQAFDSELIGDASLTKRPMRRIADPLSMMGAVIDTGDGGTPPLKIKGGQTLKGIDYTLPMASAQVKSAVLLAGLYAQGEVVVREPAPTRDHTERMFSGFGCQMECHEGNIRLQQVNLQAQTINVPTDISSAAFFMVGAAITPGSSVLIQHVGMNPTRTGVIEILKQMGANIELLNPSVVGGEPVADVKVQYRPLHGIEIPQSQVPLAIDEFPVLFIAAACAQGKTRLSGAEELRFKESDRIAAMAEGLYRMGIDVTPYDDGIEIEGGTFCGGEVQSFDDHRIAMSFAIAGLVSKKPITVNECQNIDTSFPDFIPLAQSLGMQIERL